MTKYSEVHLKNCLLIQHCSFSQILYSLVGLVDRVFASYMGGPWIKSWEEPFFQYRDKTSEYSEIYREQLTSEHFLPYNYRSSTLLRISRNIGRLLRQCGPTHETQWVYSLMVGGCQEAKYVESWPNTTFAWAGWRRFDIPVDRYGGVHFLLLCTSSSLGSATCH